MTRKVKFECEYIVNASLNVLFQMFTTPSGLSDWFANDVNVKGNIYTFIWDGSEQDAELIVKRTNYFVRYHWVDDEDPKTYFEFKLNTDELTGEVALIITDFAEPEEIDDAKSLWDSQIDKLRRNLGI